jgi:hypothetical protein
MSISSSNSGNKDSSNSCESNICIKLLNSVLEKSSDVHKLIDSIEGLGCKLPEDFFNCVYACYWDTCCSNDLIKKKLCFIIACRKCNRSDMSGGFSVVDKGDNGRYLSKDYKPKVDSMIEKLVNLDWKVFAALDCSMWRKYRGERHLHSHSDPWVGKDIVFYHHDTNWISSFCASRSMHMIRADLTWMLRTAPSMRARRSCSAYCGNI